MPPDSDREGPEPRTVIALAERVAIVETKIGSLKDDTGVIRAAIHDIKNEQQRSIAVEMRCAQALENVQQVMLDRTGQINKMEASLDTLLVNKNQVDGAWWAVGKAALIGGACLSGIAAAITATIWALQHLSVRL